MAPDPIQPLDVPAVRRLVIAFDTNAVYGAALLGLADEVNAWGARSELTVRLLVPSLVFVERQAMQRRDLRQEFDAAVVERALRSKGVDVVPFDWDDAERTSAWLAELAPDDAAWQAMKRRRLGVERTQDLPATVDWYIAGHAVAQGWLLVTDDKGPEFEHVPSRCTAETLRAAVEP